MKYVYSIFIMLLGITSLVSQNISSLDTLEESVYENTRLISASAEQGLVEANLLEKQAIKAGNKKVELMAIINQCTYYKAKIDFDGLQERARHLFAKATDYEMPNYQAIAKYYLFEVHIFTDLPDQAVAQLDEGMIYVIKAENEGTLSSGTKSNYYIGYSNYYLKVNCKFPQN